MMYEATKFEKSLSKYRAFEYCVYTALSERFPQCTMKNKTVYNNLYINIKEAGDKAMEAKMNLAEEMVAEALKNHNGLGGFDENASVSLLRADSESPTLMVFKTKSSTLFVHVAAKGNRYGIKIEQKPNKTSAL